MPEGHEISIEIEVNGERRQLDVPARMTLADALRDRLDLTGTHLGCEHGVCGACTVLLDDRSARSCIVLAAQAHGRRVTTIEGLSPPSELSPLQRALSERGGLQCGFCTPGFVVAASELLRDVPAPDEATVRTALSGNLCRCTGYEAIVDAVLSQADTEVPSQRPGWPDEPQVSNADPGAPPLDDDAGDPTGRPDERVAAEEPPRDVSGRSTTIRGLAAGLALAVSTAAAVLWYRSRRTRP
jgi:carbon-monoxide dehydrogenase small subunit